MGVCIRICSLGFKGLRFEYILLKARKQKREYRCFVQRREVISLLGWRIRISFRVQGMGNQIPQPSQALKLKPI